MSVLLETSAGDIVIDLLVDYAPTECQNFLKLCKVKYYNFSPVHSIQQNFSFQTGDPLGPNSTESDGGSSIWGLLDGPSKKSFPATFHPKLKHIERGTVSMATAPHPTNSDVRLAASQFLITLGDNTDYLDGKAAVFGKVVEGFDAIEKINNAITDKDGYPLVDIRIKHTIVLDDPFPDPKSLREPSQSPQPSKAQLATVRIADDVDLDQDVDQESAEKMRREREARAQALTLEMMGDLPFAEVKPPENILFVCKLNPVTADADLELIFSRFGKILSCEVIRDKKTGDSLQYAFIEFEEKSACEAAYFKMQGVLIDDRRIHVDFSQSVSKLADVWRGGENAKRKGRAGGGRGGWGGVADLEKWRKYRNDDGREPTDRYSMVYSEEEMRGRHKGQRDEGVLERETEGKCRDSQGKGHDQGRGRSHTRSRSRSPRKERPRGRERDDSWRKEPRHWERSHSRHRDRERERERDGGRNRDRDRGNDRDRDRGRDRDRDRGRGYDTHYHR
ncbi:cyclophilin-like protein [Xylariaceae sp. FL0594]|nr:cyclophilin-like protein [Xylariaceae sp. FL0594]